LQAGGSSIGAVHSDGRTDPFTNRIIDDAVRKPSGEKDGEKGLFLDGRHQGEVMPGAWNGKPARCAGLPDVDDAGDGRDHIQ
jgi:hypothetical protein